MRTIIIVNSRLYSFFVSFYIIVYLLCCKQLLLHIYIYKIVILIQRIIQSLVSAVSLIFVLWEFTLNLLFSSFSFHLSIIIIIFVVNLYSVFKHRVNDLFLLFLVRSS